jgi:AcrR family transcriptional regulator
MSPRKQRSPAGDGQPAPIPPSIELAWGLREPGSRGPKRALTLVAIVQAGIAVAEAEGIQSVSMARVAGELGIGTMSLYRYVNSKDELLMLMVDAGLGPPPADLRDGSSGWREGLRGWAFGVRAAYRGHPWSLKVPITAPPLGPNNVAWMEAALSSLRDTPLSEPEKLSTLLLVSGFVRNDSTLNADITAGAADRPAAMTYGAILSQLADAEHFPAVHRAIASGTLDDEDEDFESDFEFGLERILDGIGLLIERAGG